MEKIWKLRLQLMVLSLIGIGVMAYFMGHEPDSMQSKLFGLVGFAIFFVSAMVLLYTSSDDVPSSRERRKQSMTAGTTTEIGSRSTGGSGGSGSGC